MKAAVVLMMSIVVAGVVPAHAHDVGQHPAVFSPRSLPAIDASTFIVGHPASPTVHGSHANHEHPALRVKRGWRGGAIDSNAFVVLPPAGVRWVADVAAPTGGD